MMLLLRTLALLALLAVFFFSPSLGLARPAHDHLPRQLHTPFPISGACHELPH